MKVEITCPSCGRVLRVPGNGQGKVKCPHCSYSVALQSGRIVLEVSLKTEHQKPILKNHNSSGDESTTPYYIMGALIMLFFYIFCSFISWTIELDEWSGFVRSIFFLGTLCGIILPIWLYHKD